MTNELERLKTTCLAQEAEIARLMSGFDDLKSRIDSTLQFNDGSDWDAGWDAAHRRLLILINRITGGEG